MSRARLLVATGTVLALVTGCSGGAEEADEPAPTSVADLDSPALRIARVTFCDAIPDAAVTEALGAEPTSTRDWADGDPAPGTASDLANELGCAWSAPPSSTARAWVFARPVAEDFARALVGKQLRAPGCRGQADAGFGSPSVLQTCPQPGQSRRVRYAGLFAGTWLSCEVTGHEPAADLRARADAWCAAVATALDTA